MRQDDVDEHLKRRPFQPFRIQLSTGAFFDIGRSEKTTSKFSLFRGVMCRGKSELTPFRI